MIKSIIENVVDELTKKEIADLFDYCFESKLTDRVMQSSEMDRLLCDLTTVYAGEAGQIVERTLDNAIREAVRHEIENNETYEDQLRETER